MAVLVLFDIDGTILQLKQGHSKQIFSRMVDEIFGKSVDATDMPDFSGRTDLEILYDIAKKLNIKKKDIDSKIDDIWEKIYVFFSQYCTNEFIDLMPGVMELIETIDKSEEFCLGLLTGNFRENAYQKLAAFELQDYFPFGAFGSDFPDRNLLPPLALKRANKYLNNKVFYPGNTIIIGDSPRDVECAQKNNIVSIAVTTGFSDRDELSKCNPDHLFDNLSDNTQIINILTALN